MTAAAAQDRSIVRARLAAQRISESDLADPAEVVRWMTAMQAQDLTGAKWSVGLRLPGSTEADVDAALTSGDIVRSWPMRGTLHLVAAEDLRWILSLTSERLIRSARTRRDQLGLDEKDLERARELAVSALSGGRSLVRDALYGVFEAAGISPAGQRGYHVLWFLSQTGTLCLGPPDGRQQRFVLSAEWIRGARDLAGEEALGELALRYFRSHGPASIRDFSWWSSLTLGEARTGLAVVRDRLETFDRDGEEFFCTPDAVERAAAPDRLRLLPGFDEYLLGYRDRRPQLAPEQAERVVPGGNGVFFPTLVRDGRVIGTWRRTVGRRGLAVDAEPFRAGSASLASGVRRAAAGYARFLGVELVPAPS